jgi:broad specificity phosphatase PhoE
VSERTVVHLLRHGEVDNPRGILYGRLPGYHLSALGLEMAERAASWFEQRDVRSVVSSPLERACETAAPVAARLGLPVSTDDRLLEAENHFQGMVFGVGDGSLRHPSHWRHMYNPVRPSWGEPYAQLATRMLAAAGAARDAVRGHEAVLVSHQLPIWTARRSAEGKRLWHDPRSRQCSLASVTSLIYDGDRLTSVAYAEPSADLLPGANKVPGA